MAYTIPSAEAPLQNLNTSLIPVLEKESFYAFVRRFPELANHVRGARATFNKANITMDRTISHFDVEFRQQWTMVKLALMIPEDLLKSILGGTVAFDSFNKPSQNWYPREGPGIYVLGLQVDGRQGKFLRRREIEALVVNLQKYCNGYLAIVAGHPASHADVAFAKGIDGQLTRTGRAARTLFINNQDELARVRCLVTGLERRCDSRLDPTGLVAQVQSPLYVGCSDKLEQRSKDYLNRNITSINKPLGLVLSILESMGLKSSISFRVASPCCDDLLMVRGERLVAVLASAYVSQDGFNATEAGGKPGKAGLDKFEEATLQVYGLHSSAEANVDSAFADMKQRLEFLIDLGRLEEEQGELSRELRSLELPPSRTYTRADMTPLLQARHEIRRVEMEELRRQDRLNQQFLELAKITAGESIDE